MALSSRISSVVTLQYSSSTVQAFLADPGIGYCQTYMRFGTDMADDVIMFVDQEWLEGVASPIHVSGGDWMALVGVQRSGTVWVTAGTAATEAGTPSVERDWQLYDIGQRLQADTWYRMRVVADFGQRQFKSFALQGGKINYSLDLSGVRLDYPNNLPFSEAGMIYIVGALRSASLMTTVGTPITYFDNVESGRVVNGIIKPWFADGFDSTSGVGDQPITSPTIDITGYVEGKWYKERDEALFTIEKTPWALRKPGIYSAVRKTRVGVADASL
jgi:hypothetical protein